MSRIDGGVLRTATSYDADVVVVGSGPAGCAVAREAARRGAQVLVVEAGRWFGPADYPPGAFSAMSAMYRQMGTQVVIGRALMPLVQGKMVGGSSPINGAICWRTPRDVYDGWVKADPALGDALPWATLEADTDAIEARLNVRPTDPAVAGVKDHLMARGADALGLEHRPIRRNVRACEGRGRCLQGCPIGAKQSVEVTLLADAEADGARVLSDVTVTHIDRHRGRAVGVTGRAGGGGVVRIRAGKVVIAASAVQTPGLLLRSGVRQGPVGEGFACHPGVSVAGRFPEPVEMWRGATQGHEVTGLRHRGLKFETLGFGLGVLAGRLDGFGQDLARERARLAHWADWGAAVKASARGRVRSIAGRDVVFFTPNAADVARFRAGLRIMGEMMFAAGAEVVSLGVKGFPAQVTDPRDLARLETDGPTRPGAYRAAITHMFGSCRMASDPHEGVVGLDFQAHAVPGLYIADSSVFPSNLGVNPQVPIMAFATACARRVVGAS